MISCFVFRAYLSRYEYHLLEIYLFSLCVDVWGVFVFPFDRQKGLFEQHSSISRLVSQREEEDHARQ